MGGLSALATVLLLAAPMASAAGIVSFTAPYTGWTASNSNYLASTGCAAARESSQPSWSSSTGVFTFAGRANASTCGSTYNFASVYAISAISSVGFQGTHGHTSYIYLNWNMSVSAKAALSFTPSGDYSYASAYVSGTAYSYLIDITNGSYNYVTSTTTTLFGATLTSTGLYILSTGWVLSSQYMSAVLLKDHVYQVLIDIYANGGVSLYGGSGWGAATIGLSGNHGIGLASVVVY